MPLKMYLSLIVILFTVIESLDSIYHKRCVCMKWVEILQCTDLDLADYSQFRGSMTWIRKAAFTTSVDVKSANSKSDITLKVTTAVFYEYLSVMHEQSTSSSLKGSGYLYLLLVGIIWIVLTLIIATTCYLVYKCSWKKKVCRKGKTFPKKTDNDWESETLCDQFENLGVNLTAPPPPPTSGFLRRQPSENIWISFLNNIFGLKTYFSPNF